MELSNQQIYDFNQGQCVLIVDTDMMTLGSGTLAQDLMARPKGEPVTNAKASSTVSGW